MCYIDVLTYVIVKLSIQILYTSVTEYISIDVAYS